MPNPDADKLNVTMRSQETNMWCWAASGEMIMKFLGTNVTQCDQVNQRYGERECCNTPKPSKCVKGGWPEFFSNGFAHSRTVSSALSWEQIIDQIYVRKSPIAFTWRWEGGGGGHMMVLYGYALVGGEKYVVIHDPWPPNQGVAEKIITYDAYVSGNNYSHWDDFYDITRSSSPTGRELMGSPTVFPGRDSLQELFPGHADAIDTAFTAANELFQQMVGQDSPGNVLDVSCVISSVRLDEVTAIGAVSITENRTSEARDLLQERRPTTVVFGSTGGGHEVTVVCDGKTNKWRATGLSYNDLFNRIRDGQGPAGVAADSTSFAVIWVPALNQQFLIVNQAGGPLYCPLIDDAMNGFNRGENLTALELMQRLVIAAAKHDEQPR